MTDRELAVDAAHPQAQKIARQLRGRALGLYFTFRLSLAALAGLRVLELGGDSCQVRVPHGWRTANPFGSTYFAALCMGAELSTAALTMVASAAAGDRVRAICQGFDCELDNIKEAAVFTCEDGGQVFAAVRQALAWAKLKRSSWIRLAGRRRAGPSAASTSGGS